MKSYSSAVQRTCSTALSAKKIATAVKNVTGKDDRSKNQIIYGLEKSSGEILDNRVEQVLAEIGEKQSIQDCVRVGIKRERGLIVSIPALSSSPSATLIM